MEKKHSLPEEEQNEVQEPAFSYYHNSPLSTNECYSLAERKSELIKAIHEVNDEAILTELELLVFPTIHKNGPCQYSIEELKERIRESMRQIEEGNFYTHEQVKEMYKKWK